VASCAKIGAVAVMRNRGWRSSLITVAVLALQMGVSVLGTIGMCVDRPHTHGGVPAPDCLMHHSQPDSTSPETSNHGHHGEHDGGKPPDTPRLACRCSADLLTLLTAEIAVIPIGISIGSPDVAASALHERVQSAPDVRLVPLSPPPKPSLT
jgi:hypothetical protein